MKLFEGTINTLEKSLNYASAKNNAISNNIANVDTPFFKAGDVVFKHALNGALERQLELKQTHSKHIPHAQINQSFETIVRQGTTYNHNGNNVDIDKEMTDLAKNQIYYRSMVDRLNGKFQSLQMVVRGGR